MSDSPRQTRPQPAIAPPNILLKWQTWAFGLAIMLIPFFVPIPHSPRPGETAEQFADRVLGQLTENGIFGEDGKLTPEVRRILKSMEPRE